MDRDFRGLSRKGAAGRRQSTAIKNESMEEMRVDRNSIECDGKNVGIKRGRRVRFFHLCRPS